MITNNLPITDYISWLRRSILINSILYYELDTNTLTDKQYDARAYELVDLINTYPDEFNESEYHDVYIGFDGTTGFDLVSKLSHKHRDYLYRIAQAGLLYASSNKTSRKNNK